jgi:TonB-dependent SusC/RagA subfamily outer membrane receptor
MPTVRGVVRRLPFFDATCAWMVFRAEMSISKPGFTCSYQQFIRGKNMDKTLQASGFRRLTGTLGKCSVCQEYKTALKGCRKNDRRREEIWLTYRGHLILQALERRSYYDRRLLAIKYPDDFLSCIVDGSTQRYHNCPMLDDHTVLKDASAAIYGARAAYGVILITTKKGSAGAISVDVNSGAQFDAPLTLPNLQNEYGQGNGGVFGARSSASWGPKMNNQPLTDWTGKSQNLVPQPNNVSGFFQIGTSFNNSVGIKGGSEKVQSYFSFTNNQVSGIVPGNTLDRNTINLRTSANLSKKFSTDAKVTYVNQMLNNKLL